MVDGALPVEHLLEDVGRRTTGQVLVDDQKRAGALHARGDEPADIEGQERARVDDLDLDPRGHEIAGGLEGDAAERAVRDEREVASRADRLGHPERHGELRDVLRDALFQAVAREHLDDDGRVIAAQQRVVEAGGLRHVARDADVHAAQRAEDQLHRRAGVPDPLQAVALRANDHRRLLATGGAMAERREVVRGDLEREEQVVDVLDVSPRRSPAREWSPLGSRCR